MTPHLWTNSCGLVTLPSNKIKINNVADFPGYVCYYPITPGIMSAVWGIYELNTHSSETWATSAPASTPAPVYLSCSFISHHTWLHNLLSGAINNSAFLIAPAYMCSLSYSPHRAVRNVQYINSSRMNGRSDRQANTRRHPSDSPWQLRHLHKAEHIHVCCRLQLPSTSLRFHCPTLCLAARNK